MLAIQTGDGYDAARLLLPAMRKLAVEHLGEPCYAAVPNRDFLIMWSQSNPEEFQTLVRAQVRQDCQSQPYPLTSTVFVVTDSAAVFAGVAESLPADLAVVRLYENYLTTFAINQGPAS